MKEERKKRLFEDFPEISTEVWRAKIESDLKGADFEKKLIWHTDEGIPVMPFYRSEHMDELEYLEQTGTLKPDSETPNGWTICQDINPGKNQLEANSRIISALKGGAQAIVIHLEQAGRVDKSMLDQVLKDVPLAETEILFQGFLGADALYQHYTNLATERAVDPSNLKGSLGADPIGKMVYTGIPLATSQALGKLVRKVSESSPGLRVIDVNGSQIQNAGGSLVEEMAFTLAMANEYMVLLTNQGIDSSLAAKSMQLSMSSGSNYFMEIAKIRATRILWANICGAYGMGEDKNRIPIHTTTSQWNLTLYDPHTNILRGTTEAMSAILGGADYISVLPFDYPYDRSSAFSDRVARNLQILLRDEAYFDRVSDPSAGSYYIENLTDALAKSAWDLFRETEARGGFRKALESGWVQKTVHKSKIRKLERISSGKYTLLGTNIFPNFKEVILEDIPRGKNADTLEPVFEPIKPFRFASVFEDLRLETERSGQRPSVFLFKYGSPPWATARASFAGNFFACAGYSIIDQTIFSTVEAGIEAQRKTRPSLIVLCSTDETYPELAMKLKDEIGESSILVVAGNPAESINELKNAGVKHFIHAGTNLLESLRQFNKLLLQPPVTHN